MNKFISNDVVVFQTGSNAYRIIIDHYFISWNNNKVLITPLIGDSDQLIVNDINEFNLAINNLYNIISIDNDQIISVNCKELIKLIEKLLSLESFS